MLRPALVALAILLIIPACADVGEAPVAETSAISDTATATAATPDGQPVPVDTARSSIEWTASRVTRAHVGGFDVFSGVVYLDGDRVTGADVTAQVASVFTDAERLTGHLKTDDFFNVAVHPDIRFVVDSLAVIAPADGAGSGGATHTAHGSITMIGRTNRVTFPASISLADGTVTADADFIINRQDWGLSYPGQPDDLVGDDVRMRLHVVAGQ